MNSLRLTKHNCLTLSLFLTFALAHPTYAQLTVSPTKTATALSSKLAGPGITILKPVLTCAGAANGTFVSKSTPITIDSGIILTTGNAVQAIGPESFLASTNMGTPGDPSLAALAMATTYDACALEFDFVATGDTVSFNYQFGSEEYNHSTCGPYNDAFAFFISGPGIAGTQNMALVPGTNIPVTVNSVNSGVPGSGYTLANCTIMGPGSPFPAYFYDNTGGTQVTYKGYTVKMAAVHSVTPCDTYHLKIAVCDAGNRIYDSGVFIEAGSLKANSFSFDHIDSVGATIAGVSHTIVRGCTPATLKVVSSRVYSGSKTVHFTYGGTAIEGTDFTAPDSAIIAAGTDSVLISIAALTGFTSGAKKIEIYLTSPYSCGIADSIAINIMDTPSANILTPDTTICPSTSFTIRVSGTPGLSYNWLPPTGLSSTTLMQPIATPPVTTTYLMTATLPGSGCPAIAKSISATLINIYVAILTPDTTICKGSSVNILVDGSATYTYKWLPSAGVNNPNSQYPIVTPAANTVYSLTVTSSTCSYSGHVKISVVDPEATILTPDTSVCMGGTVSIRVSGDATLTYNWLPTTGLDNPYVMQPSATPDVVTTYTMTAATTRKSGAVCFVNKNITITVIPLPAVDAGPDLQVCEGMPILFNAAPYSGNYSYHWTGPNDYSSILKDAVMDKSQIAAQGIYSLTVVDLNSGCSASDTTFVRVYKSAVTLTNVTTDQTIMYGDNIQLNADNALYYLWTPDNGSLDNPNINTPVATPLAPTTYTVTGIDIHGCRDSATVNINLNYDNIKIPDAFSPNGDGLNDYFHIYNPGFFKLVSMSIFNRWGTLIYHLTESSGRGWDGTYNGVPQDIGTYNYYIIISNPQDQLQYYKGNLTLIR